MDLFLFINWFPYKSAEPFFFSEFGFTQQNADSVTVFSLYGKPEDRTVEPTGRTTFLQPVLPSSQDKKKLFVNGLLNTARTPFHWKEFFGKQVFLSTQKMRWFFISLFITRAGLSSPAFRELAARIEQSTHPVLYFYWGNNLAWIIPYLRRKFPHKKLKIVIRLHGSDLYEHLTGNYSPVRQQVFSSADLIATVSESGKNYLAQKYPEFAHKIIFSRLGIFDNGLNPFSKTDEFHIVSVSNMIPLKRIHLIFEALQQTNSRIVWHHFGKGPLEASLKAQAETKRENLDIRFHGFVTNEALMDFYKKQSVDLFLNVSSSEGLPFSIMEALSFGIPVIATDVGGTAELVSEQTGELIEADFDTQYLASSIENILNLDTESTARLRKNAREMFEQKVSAKVNYQQFYDQLKQL